MSSFIRSEPPWEKIPTADYIMQMTKEHNELLDKLEQSSGIDFTTYRIDPVIMIEDIKTRYGEVHNSYVRNYIIFNRQRNACAKYMKYMSKYKGITKEIAREQFWKIKGGNDNGT